ncbi:hypothetical protein [Methanobrevibacter filiformis]|uniref:Uncharacterized protein n=1 Tax=Methanobrevibacter filiformis TaxID=55758 RepID=A0A166ENB4_9EURY|nr:hypothetical protein [Methanobrevibacter filiformis]KZX16839.1 hypothetical protein MBFIL_04690 [Methanobrevibacter filiformis]
MRIPSLIAFILSIVFFLDGIVALVIIIGAIFPDFVIIGNSLFRLIVLVVMGILSSSFYNYVQKNRDDPRSSDFGQKLSIFTVVALFFFFCYLLI